MYISENIYVFMCTYINMYTPVCVDGYILMCVYIYVHTYIRGGKGRLEVVIGFALGRYTVQV